jgi:hypothetical protein
VWDAQLGNPLAANFVASHIKSLLYSLAPAYPNWQYLVLVGDDRMIPHRRLQDMALVANERAYADLAGTPILSGSLGLRYMLTDDYYAGLYPMPYQGREIYPPQLALGRLVETPSEIITAINAFLATPVVAPQDSLVTGYDFLIDQARAVSHTLGMQGVSNTTLIDNAWTATVFSSTLFPRSDSFDILSLNSHFAHDLFYPNGPDTPSNYIYASSIMAPPDYTSVLAFSVGCHSGLNVPDAGAPFPTDWAQVFLRAQAGVFIGNTGFGYGDSDLIAYSERLMTNFAEELGYWANGGAQRPTVGEAFLRAKQRYLNTVFAASFSNYDEKILATATLYGLPMLGVTMPVTTAAAPGFHAPTASALQSSLKTGASSALTITQYSLALSYTVTTVPGVGEYFQVWGENDLHVAGARPIQPRTSVDVASPNSVAHGVLWTGGTFQASTNFNPVVSHVMTEETYSEIEPTYPTLSWYPAQLGAINRFLSLDGLPHERLVVVPGQFRATLFSTNTIGIARLYTDLQFEVYHAAPDETDFIAPLIWEVKAQNIGAEVRFSVLAEDDDGALQRVVVVYHPMISHIWRVIELTYDPYADEFVGSVPAAGPLEFVAQAVDGAGNVALSLDHGDPYQQTAAYFTFLPIIKR